jgi:carboxylesterase
VTHSVLTAPFSLGPAVAEARAAVLLLHGFTGSPWEVRPLGEALAAHGFHVDAPRLPGHGTVPEEMLSVSAEDWLAATRQRYLTLSKGPQPLFVVGFSMGALLATLLAAESQRKPQALVLLAPALRLQNPAARVLRRLPWLRYTPLSHRWIEKHSIDVTDELAQREAPLLRRYPVARLFDFFDLQKKSREVASQVTVRALILYAVHDSVVDGRGARELATLLPHATVQPLLRGRHIVCRDIDRAAVTAATLQFLESDGVS